MNRTLARRLGVIMVVCATAAQAWSQAAPVTVPAGMDAQALQLLATANAKTAQAAEIGTCADERAAVNAGASACRDSACVIALAAISALTPCAVMQVAARAAPAPAPAPQIINAAPTPTMGERILTGIGWGFSKLFDTAVALGPSYANLRLGTVQSNNSTALAIRQSDNALAATQSTNNAFAALGNNIQGTAAAGFRSNERLAADAFGAIVKLPPTTQIITHDGSPVTIGNGSVANVQLGDANRQGSPGPCAATAGNTSATTGGGTSNATSPCTSN